MNLFQWKSGTDCAQLPLAVRIPIRPLPEQSRAAYLTRKVLNTRYKFHPSDGIITATNPQIPELRESEITYRNRVYKRAHKLALRGKWLACDITINVHLGNLGIPLTDPQRESIKIAKSYSIWDWFGPCLEEAYADF